MQRPRGSKSWGTDGTSFRTGVILWSPGRPHPWLCTPKRTGHARKWEGRSRDEPWSCSDFFLKCTCTFLLATDYAGSPPNREDNSPRHGHATAGPGEEERELASLTVLLSSSGPTPTCLGQSVRLHPFLNHDVQLTTRKMEARHAARPFTHNSGCLDPDA